MSIFRLSRWCEISILNFFWNPELLLKFLDFWLIFCVWSLNIPSKKCYIAIWNDSFLDFLPHGSHRIRYPMEWTALTSLMKTSWWDHEHDEYQGAYWPSRKLNLRFSSHIWLFSFSPLPMGRMLSLWTATGEESMDSGQGFIGCSCTVKRYPYVLNGGKWNS